MKGLGQWGVHGQVLKRAWVTQAYLNNIGQETLQYLPHTLTLDWTTEGKATRTGTLSCNRKKKKKTIRWISHSTLDYTRPKATCSRCTNPKLSACPTWRPKWVGARYDGVSLSCAGGITRHQSTMGLPKVNKNESFATLWECGLPYTIKCICQVQYPILSTRCTPWHSWVHDIKGLSNICKFILRKRGPYSQFITTGRYLRACTTKCPVTVFQNNFCMVISLRMMAHRQA